MAKSKPKLSYSFSFVHEKGSIGYYNVIYNRLKGLSDSALCFVHLERKGSSLLLLDGMHRHDEQQISVIEFDRSDDDAPAMIINGERLNITQYTSIKAGDKEMYYLDELPDGTWRVAHSDYVIPAYWNREEVIIHNNIIRIEIAEDPSNGKNYNDLRTEATQPTEGVRGQKSVFLIESNDQFLAIPIEKEPSPFGDKVGELNPHPWLKWRQDRVELGLWNNAGDGPINDLSNRRAFMNSSKWTELDYTEYEEPELTTGLPYKALSLGWVIWYHMKTGFNIERCHRFGEQKMKEQNV